MSHEKALWSAITNEINPGWDIKTPAHMQPGGMNLPEYRVFVYVVDTSTGWICAGAISEKTMKDVALELSKEEHKAASMRDMAGGHIVSCGKDDLMSDTSEAQQCLSAAIGALTQTQSYQLALKKSLNGHWLYMTYKLKDQTLLSRPVFFSKPEIANGFAPMGVLRPLLRRVVDQDTTNAMATPTVFKQIKDGGGAMLAPEFGGEPAIRPPVER